MKDRDGGLQQRGTTYHVWKVAVEDNAGAAKPPYDWNASRDLGGEVRTDSG